MSEPKRGEIWRADLEPTRGDEINKTRPVVVLSDDNVGVLELRSADSNYKLESALRSLSVDGAS